MSQVPNPKDIDDTTIEIREIWNNNLEAEMNLIKNAIDAFPIVAIDTEFPGAVYSTGTTNASPKPYQDSYYETLKRNVDALKLIQLGFTLSDEQGNLPTCGTNNRPCVWQFNFREFNQKTDDFSEDSIKLLRSANIDFDRFIQFGVESERFGNLLMGSGLVRNHNIKWVMFQCGYDLGYLLKVLTGKNLPDQKSEFLLLVKRYFPVVYDIRYLMMFCNNLRGGLDSVAETLGVKRVGTAHQAGSDSLVTLRVFNKMRESYSLEKHSGSMFGLLIVDNTQ